MTHEDPYQEQFDMHIIVPPHARTDDPETSHAAAASIEGNRHAERLTRQLLAAYADGSELTDFEAMVKSNNVGHNWKRCSDLRREKLIERVTDEDGRFVTRVGDSGRRAMVCKITDAGRMELGR